MKMKIFLIFTLLWQIECYKILVISSVPGPSHFTLAFSLAKELAGRGHQVSFINPFPQKVPIKNLQDIPIRESIAFLRGLGKVLIRMGELGVLANLNVESTLGAATTEYAFNNTNVQKLLNSKDETFDVVIIEHFANEALAGIGHHFKAPVILLSSVPSCFKNNYIFGNPAPTSYVPDIYSDLPPKMSFIQRIKNFMYYNFNNLIREVLMMTKQRKLFKKYVKTDLELEDVLYNVSLFFANSHPSFSNLVPHFPNIIEIGGYHVGEPSKLPEDIQMFLDGAKDGVIVFSMGSNLKSKDLNPSIRKAILKSFAKIKAHILWKFEEDLPEAPPNVKIVSWMPQKDIIGHPNIRGLISHGGLLSLIEAIYYGVPIIGIPIFSDQHNNIAAAVANGFAIHISLDSLTEQSFTQALNQILYNKKYFENAKTRSKFLHDQPIKPMDLAVFWVEQIIRNRGTPFLQSEIIGLEWYQHENLDVFLPIIIILSALLIVQYHLLKKCVVKLFHIKSTSKDNEQQINCVKTSQE